MEPLVQSLINFLNLESTILIQTHDFPDHDAIGSAYGLASLLAVKGYTTMITYGGSIQSISLNKMIEHLSIATKPIEALDTSLNYQVILVDGSPAVGTVKKIVGSLVGVIDHHPARKKTKSQFIDIRTDAGSCSAIVWSYWNELELIPDKTTATALLSGIQLDTDFLSRKVSPIDLDAHRALYFIADTSIASEIVKTTLSVEQLPFIGEAIKNAHIQNKTLLIEINKEYSSELLSVLADFLLRLQDVNFVVAVSKGGTFYRVSARTKDNEIDAGYVLHKVLKEIGSGGGHPHMAGGQIRAKDYPKTSTLLASIINEITLYKEKDLNDFIN